MEQKQRQEEFERTAMNAKELVKDARGARKLEDWANSQIQELIEADLARVEEEKDADNKIIALRVYNNQGDLLYFQDVVATNKLEQDLELLQTKTKV